MNAPPFGQIGQMIKLWVLICMVHLTVRFCHVMYVFQSESTGKMVKHTQTIHQQIADKLFGCVWPFCDIGA